MTIYDEIAATVATLDEIDFRTTCLLNEMVAELDLLGDRLRWVLTEEAP